MIPIFFFVFICTSNDTGELPPFLSVPMSYSSKSAIYLLNSIIAVDLKALPYFIYYLLSIFAATILDIGLKDDYILVLYDLIFIVFIGLYLFLRSTAL